MTCHLYDFDLWCLVRQDRVRGINVLHIDLLIRALRDQIGEQHPEVDGIQMRSHRELVRIDGRPHRLSNRANSWSLELRRIDQSVERVLSSHVHPVDKLCSVQRKALECDVELGQWSHGDLEQERSSDGINSCTWLIKSWNVLERQSSPDT